MNPTKAELRRSLKPEERHAKSTAIASRLWQAIDWSQVKTLHCFESIERLGEVDISDFITALQAEYPNIQLFTSRQINKIWEIISLTDGRPVAEPQFNVIIVPMLGFDQTLHRIGYGGGYYDQFLATQPSAQKIGVSFDLGKTNHIPIEPHDIPLDTIITETGLI
jgi:5,10-methenyltetrahydrofolate synthetase